MFEKNRSISFNSNSMFSWPGWRTSSLEEYMECRVIKRKFKKMFPVPDNPAKCKIILNVLLITVIAKLLAISREVVMELTYQAVM